MNELDKIMLNKLNYYALFIAIIKNVSAKEALILMKISPDSEKEDN